MKYKTNHHLYAIQKISWDLPLARKGFLATTAIVKHTLSRILWLAWRFRANVFMYAQDNAQTCGRYYITNFLQQYKDHCSGKFLEFGNNYFQHIFSQSQITSYDIIDVVDHDGVTIHADIQDCPQIPSDTYDVIVCTQVLEHVANPFKAVQELHRILKPGGSLLLTVPASYPYHASPYDYWRFTRDSLHLLLDPLFRQVKLHSYGNQLTVVATYWYWKANQLPKHALDMTSPNNPTTLCVYTVK